MFKRNILTIIIFAMTSLFITGSAFADTKEIIYKVEGITCDRCTASLLITLKETKGVIDAKVEYKKGEAWIKYDDQNTTISKLRDTINGTGFKAGEEIKKQKTTTKR